MAPKKNKRKNYLEELRTMSLDDLVKKLSEYKRELLALRLKKIGEELTDNSQFRKVGIKIAMVYTIIKEKNMKSYAS